VFAIFFAAVLLAVANPIWSLRPASQTVTCVACVDGREGQKKFFWHLSFLCLYTHCLKLYSWCTKQQSFTEKKQATIFKFVFLCVCLSCYSFNRVCAALEAKSTSTRHYLSPCWSCGCVKFSTVLAHVHKQKLTANDLWRRKSALDRNYRQNKSVLPQKHLQKCS